MKLDDYSSTKAAQAAKHQLIATHFGLMKEGHIIDSWQYQFSQLELYSHGRGLTDFFGTVPIRIIVPSTAGGLAPDHESFGWKGLINSYAADAAVWFAFSLTTESEAKTFYKTHSPVIIFSCVENDEVIELSVQWKNKDWVCAAE